MSSEQTPLLGEQHSPYTTFTKSQKLWILIAASAASVLSPLSANIYFPALQSIRKELNVTESVLNLTITSYMIFQGLSPAFIGSLSDSIGRRPVYIFCFTTYIVANVALALSNSFMALLLLRCLQSTGISSTVSLVFGVTTDLVQSAERGRYFVLTSAGPILGPGLGPVLGGVVTQYLGWRYVFLVLAAAAVTLLTLFLLFIPETCRNVVGNGSVRPKHFWNKTFVSFMYANRGDAFDRTTSSQSQDIPKTAHTNPIRSLKVLFEYPTSPIIIFNGLTFGMYYATMASLPESLHDIYNFDEVRVGLAYIPVSVGTILATVGNGFIVDWNYRRLANKVGISTEESRNMNFAAAKRLGFSFEAARLQIAIPAIVIACVSIIGYGWAMEAKTAPIIPLLLLFGFGWGNTAAFFVMSLLIVDINSSSAASATGANNLVRCFVGAGGAALVMPTINQLGIGWTFTALTGVWLAFSPLVLALLFGKGKEDEE